MTRRNCLKMPDKNLSDQHATCDEIIKYHYIYFIFPIFFGAFSFIIFKLSDTCPAVANFILDSHLTTAFFVLDKITLPRSDFELAPIYDQFGIKYFNIAVYMQGITSLTAIYALCVATRAARFAITPFTTPSSSKKVGAAAVIVAGTLLFHPASFSPDRHAWNLVDPAGFYFLREGIVLSLGYYSLYIVIVNVLVSLRSR